MEIKLITKLEELEGTCYFEFLPEKYDNKCWNSNSVFIDEEVFYFIEKIFEKYVDDYDHYSFMEINQNISNKIIDELMKFSNRLKTISNYKEIPEYNYFFDDGYFNSEYYENYFKNNWNSMKNDIIKLILDVSNWIKYNINKTNIISILGI